MRTHFMFPALLCTLISSAACNNDVAWAIDSDGDDAEGSTGDEEFEQGLPEDPEGSDPDDDAPGVPGVDEPAPAPEPGLDDQEKGPTPNPAPDDEQLDNAPKVPATCGNGQLDEAEACDDGNDDNTDGCLVTCSIPSTCLVIKNHVPNAPDGHYVVQPPGLDAFEVYCDMGTDGGGYTFLKIDTAKPMTAPEAEEECAKWDMQLLIPRTFAHLYSAFWVAMDLHIGQSAGLDYLTMFGIYPAYEGAPCDYAPLHSQSAACDWEASDGGPFWISDRVDIGAPTGYGAPDASMAYTFGKAGNLVSYTEIAAGGAQSQVFMCDFGDKQ